MLTLHIASDEQHKKEAAKTRAQGQLHFCISLSSSACHSRITRCHRGPSRGRRVRLLKSKLRRTTKSTWRFNPQPHSLTSYSCNQQTSRQSIRQQARLDFVINNSSTREEAVEAAAQDASESVCTLSSYRQSDRYPVPPACCSCSCSSTHSNRPLPQRTLLHPIFESISTRRDSFLLRVRPQSEENYTTGHPSIHYRVLRPFRSRIHHQRLRHRKSR